jgi:hypothetical protein
MEFKEFFYEISQQKAKSTYKYLAKEKEIDMKNPENNLKIIINI